MMTPRTFITHLTTVALSALMIAGCAVRDKTLDYHTSNFVAPDAPTQLTVDETYRVGPTDTLGVLVFGVPEYSGDFVVDASGNIQLPLVGDVNVDAMTTTGVAREVTRRLAATYLKSPVVQVQIKSATSKRVTIDGAVGMPGVYPIGVKSTLVQTIALAHGTNDKANPRRTVVFRRVRGERMVAAFDLTDIRKGRAPDPDIYPGDIVVVQGLVGTQLFQTVISTIPILGLFARF